MSRTLAQETLWLAAHPEFTQRPATMEEFLGEGYLSIYDSVRPGVRDVLISIFDQEGGLDNHGKRISRVERAIFTGGIGIGKQLDPTEVVLTPTGWREIQHLEVGDKVIGSDGRAHSVTSVHHWDDVERYRLHFKDGTWVNCGADHLWTFRKKSTGKYNNKLETLDTRELATRTLKYGDSYVYKLPDLAPVQYANSQEPLVDPYIMGLLLANGAFSRGTPSIACHDDDADWIIASVEKRIPKLSAKYYDGRVQISGTSGKTNWVQLAIKALGLVDVTARDKFIPKSYIYASPEERLSLLRGLMDGDGSQCGNNRQDFSTSSKKLASDVVDLVRSLGGYCTLTEFSRRGAIEYQVHVNLDQVCPFLIPRKADAWKPRTNQRPSRALVKIEKIENGPGVCISVDSPDKLYVTKDFILTHNTTMASIALLYMVHWVLCLKDPQKFYNLLPGSRIAFMMMSTSEQQAREVLFGDITARMNTSEWFKNYAERDPKYTKQIRFNTKDIWILPGDSRDTTFEGYNILGGVLDEADSHRQTKEKDYAEDGYDTIINRIKSRYVDNTDPTREGHKGLIIIIGQMKRAGGFAAKKYEEFKEDKHSYAKRLTIWESFGWDKYTLDDGKRNSFWYDIKRKIILPEGTWEVIDPKSAPENLIEVPKQYLHEFKNKPEKALKDLAGIPPFSSDPFISMFSKITDCQERYELSHPEDPGGPVNDSCTEPKFAEWFKPENSARRTVHLDLAYSSGGDAATVVVGHVSHLEETEDGDFSPYIIIDALVRVRARPGQEILLKDMRQYVYDLVARKFKINKVTMDGFQCLSGNTKIPLLDGTVKTLKELEGEEDFWVYSVNKDGRIVPGKAKKARWTGYREDMVNVFLDNLTMVTATSDHPFMLRDGTYKLAGDLEKGDSLMPLYRRRKILSEGSGDYEQVKHPEPDSAGRFWQFTHSLVSHEIYGKLPKGWVTHHVDFTRSNNAPENLRQMTNSDHRKLHAELSRDRFKDLWNDPDWAEAHKSRLSALRTEEQLGKFGKDSKRYRHDFTIKDIEVAHKELIDAGINPTRRIMSKYLGVSQDMLYARVREGGYESWGDYRDAHEPAYTSNHKVIGVQSAPPEDVYDIEVEEYHNFAVEAGVFVHNSVDTMQQFRRRRIRTEYLSIDRSKQPYEDLRDAIYEGRLEFPKYVTYKNPGDAEVQDILVKELLELTDTGPKIDHPRSGSKDLADGCAGVVHTLMNDNTYRKGVSYGSRVNKSSMSSDELEKLIEGFSSNPLSPGLPGMRNIGSVQIDPAMRGASVDLPPRFLGKS